MASDTPDIDPGDGEIVGGDPTASSAAIAAAATCLACSAAIVGPFCANCGQKNDDMRRSSFVLFKDFLKDTFAFDSRMWRTLGLMAVRPGLVATNYSHGRRSRYTPPVRLFLVVSFLFFLDLGITHTMFVAVDVREKTAAEIAADKMALEEAMREAGPEASEAIEAARKARSALIVDDKAVDCDIKVTTRFFVQPEDVRFDAAKWRACSDSLAKAATDELETERLAKDAGGEGPSEEDFVSGLQRVLAGVDLMATNPVAFNSGINTWLPRVMFFMAPVLALLMALFIRGRDALLFDHLVLSLYSHAAAFAVIGVAIALSQFGVPHVFPAAMAALAIYFIIAIKRAYHRGWAKTIYTAMFVGVLYVIVLSGAVGYIITRQIWTAAA